MNDAQRRALHICTLVRVVQALADFMCDVHRILRRQKFASLCQLPKYVFDILALNALHGDEEVFLNPTKIVDLNNIWMLQFDGYLGFIDEHIDEFIVIRKVLQDAFDDKKFFEAAMRE